MSEGQLEGDTSGGAAITAPTHVTFRLIIQSSQCGSLIGKGGAKIKEIREVSLCVFYFGLFEIQTFADCLHIECLLDEVEVLQRLIKKRQHLFEVAWPIILGRVKNLDI